MSSASADTKSSSKELKFTDKKLPLKISLQKPNGANFGSVIAYPAEQFMFQPCSAKDKVKMPFGFSTPYDPSKSNGKDAAVKGNETLSKANPKMQGRLASATYAVSEEFYHWEETNLRSALIDAILPHFEVFFASEKNVLKECTTPEKKKDYINSCLAPIITQGEKDGKKYQPTIHTEVSWERPEYATVLKFAKGNEMKQETFTDLADLLAKYPSSNLRNVQAIPVIALSRVTARPKMKAINAKWVTRTVVVYVDTAQSSQVAVDLQDSEMETSSSSASTSEDTRNVVL